MQWSVLVNELLDRLVLTQGELAEHCCVGQQSVSAWKLGQRTPCTVARRRLLEMARKEGVERQAHLPGWSAAESRSGEAIG